jgi:hypothetical protein
VYAVYQAGFSKTFRAITGGMIVFVYPIPIRLVSTRF